MNAGDRPRFGKGVRLHHDGDGSTMLLVPEGALVLNAQAAAALELVDGSRSVGDITAAVVQQFDVDEERASEGVRDLLARLAERRLIETS